MSFTDRKGLLKPEDVCNIIRTCGESKVYELKFADLEIRFGKPPMLEPQRAVSKEILAIQSKEKEKAFIEAEKAVKELQLENMLLEDPLGYEELVAQQELSEDG